MHNVGRHCIQFPPFGAYLVLPLAHFLAPYRVFVNFFLMVTFVVQFPHNFVACHPYSGVTKGTAGGAS